MEAETLRKESNDRADRKIVVKRAHQGAACNVNRPVSHKRALPDQTVSHYCHAAIDHFSFDSEKTLESCFAATLRSLHAAEASPPRE